MNTRPLRVSLRALFPAPRPAAALTGITFAPQRSDAGDLHYGRGEAGTPRAASASARCWRWRLTCWIKQPARRPRSRPLCRARTAGAEPGLQPRLR
ncbi:hypothetical protein ACVXG7_14655 [Enterobacter hormaechei]